MDTVVVFWSQTGNTENMANGILDGLNSSGGSAKLYRVEEISAQEAQKYKKIALGCPAMGNESLEKEEFEPFFEELLPLLEGNLVALFGSYGWGEGEWMQSWEAKLKDSKAKLYSSLAINESLDSIYEEAFMFGKTFGENNS